MATPLPTSRRSSRVLWATAPRSISYQVGRSEADPRIPTACCTSLGIASPPSQPLLRQPQAAQEAAQPLGGGARQHPRRAALDHPALIHKHDVLAYLASEV